MSIESILNMLNAAHGKVISLTRVLRWWRPTPLMCQPTFRSSGSENSVKYRQIW